MLKWFIHRKLRDLERKYRYDAFKLGIAAPDSVAGSSGMRARLA